MIIGNNCMCVLFFYEVYEDPSCGVSLYSQNMFSGLINSLSGRLLIFFVISIWCGSSFLHWISLVFFWGFTYPFTWFSSCTLGKVCYGVIFCTFPVCVFHALGSHALKHMHDHYFGHLMPINISCSNCLVFLNVFEVYGFLM